MSNRAQRVIDCCRTLATFTEEPGRTTRTFLSPPMVDVHRHLGSWMSSIGMQVTVDAVGNLRGVRMGEGPRLIIGSHLDTVPNAGAFDGVLGVVIGIALAEIASDHVIEVIGFSEEEGVRLGVPFIGSRAFVGTLDAATLAFAPKTAAYLEFHIEQGPVLESLQLPLGVVDAIAGQSRLEVTFEGHANHAGTTPMELRRDALAAAAQWIVLVEQVATAHDGLVATTGRMQIEPNATNVIPGRVTVSLDVRHRCDEHRQAAVRQLIAAASNIAGRRGVTMHYQQHLDQPAVPMNVALRDRLATAVKSAGYPLHHMTSGAGHDAMIVAPHIPSAMLFLRSPGGISHSPDETVLVEDVEAAIAVGEKFLCQTS